MAIDITTEQLLSLADAAKRLPGGRPGRKRHVSWFLRHKDDIELIRLGGQWYTSVEALQRYVERSTEAPIPQSPAPLRSTGERCRAVDKATRELAKHGI